MRITKASLKREASTLKVQRRKRAGVVVPEAAAVDLEVHQPLSRTWKLCAVRSTQRRKQTSSSMARFSERRHLRAHPLLRFSPVPERLGPSPSALHSITGIFTLAIRDPSFATNTQTAT